MRSTSHGRQMAVVSSSAILPRAPSAPYLRYVEFAFWSSLRFPRSNPTSLPDPIRTNVWRVKVKHNADPCTRSLKKSAALAEPG